MTNAPDYQQDTSPPYAAPHSLSEEELSAVYRAKLMFRALVVVGVAFVLVISVASSTGVWLIRDTQIHNTRVAAETHTLAAQSKRTADLIASCVNPRGSCHAQSERRTANAVGVLNRYVVLSASCTAHLLATGQASNASQGELTNLITACVVRQLAHNAGHR